MNIDREVPDLRGNAIRVGSLIRVLEVPRLYAHAAPEDVEQVTALLGAVLEVYEVDAHGLAWVSTWSSPDNLLQVRHTLGLRSKQMERVAQAPTGPRNSPQPGALGAPARTAQPSATAAAAARAARYEARIR